MSAAKRKGTAFESGVRDFLNDAFRAAGVTRKAYRPAQEGFRDTGDLHGLSPFILQAKAWKDLTAALREGVDGAQVQAVHAGEDFGAAVIKRPRKPIGDAYVVLPLRVFADLLVRLWASEQE